MARRSMLLLAVLLTGLLAAANAGEWPQFRGPNASGTPEDSGLPTEWSADQNIAWKTAVPGIGWSQPIVWGDKIFVTTAVTENQPKPSAGGGGGGGFGRGRGGFGPPPGDGPPGRGPDGARREDGPPRGEGGPPPGEDGPPRRRRGGEGQGDDAGPPPGDNPPPREGAQNNNGDTPPPRRRGRGRGGFGGRGGRGGFGGRGGSPPDQVYRFEIHCLDLASGDTLWKQVALERKPSISIHSTNTFASETPVTDGEHLYAYFGMHGLFCYDLEGNQVWKKELGSFPMQNGWGTGSSPVLDGDRLFIQCDNEEKSFLVALDKRSGDELWKKEREEKSNWGTPFVWKHPGRMELVTAGANRIRSYDPATGDILWELGNLGGDSRATPVANDDMLIVGCGGSFGESALYAIKAGATGDISLKSGEKSNAGVLWTTMQAGPRMASPLLYDGYVYILEQRGGILGCYDASSGKEVYKKRIPEAGGFTSSPWAHDGKVFCLDAKGNTTVLAAGPEFKILGANKLGDEMTWSSPAFADGRILLRTEQNLYCIK